MLLYLENSKICCIFATVLERNPKLEANLLLTRQTEIWYISYRGAKSNRFRIYESEADIIYSVEHYFSLFPDGFTRALFATKLSTTLRFLYIYNDLIL